MKSSHVREVIIDALEEQGWKVDSKEVLDWGQDELVLHLPNKKGSFDEGVRIVIDIYPVEK